MKPQTSAIIHILSLCALTGCTEDYLATGFPLLDGQPVSEAVHYLGPPTEEKKISGKTTYSWVNNQSGSFYVPSDVSYPVVIQNNGHPIVSHSGPNAPPMDDFYNWSCRLDIVVKSSVIVHTGYKGNTAGCEIFSDKLKPLVTAAGKKKAAQ